MPTSQAPLFTPASFTRFGDLLRFLRRRSQLSQRDLSIAVGYSFAQISRLEQGQRLPDPTVIAATFVAALGLDREPQWATRLVELAERAHHERHEAELATFAQANARTYEAATEETASQDPLEPIPAPVPHEVPRLHLIARLHARLVAERRVVIGGLAGMGKTTLAAALAREYAETTPVFWLTFTTGVTNSVDVLMRQLAHFLIAHGQTEAQPLLWDASEDQRPLPLDQQLRLLSTGLARLTQPSLGKHGRPPLLCFDNVHLIQHDAVMIQVLRHLAATSPARILLTSREILVTLPGWPQIALHGMEILEGHELIAHLLASESARFDVPAWADQLLEKTAGSPMLVNLAVGQMLDQQLEPFHYIVQIERQPQIAAYLLETIGGQLPTDTWALLALLSVFRQPVNLYDPRLAEFLGVVGFLSNLTSPLADLIHHHLIHHPVRAQCHPLVRDYVYATLLVQPLYRRQLHRIAAEWSEEGLDDHIEASYHYCQSGDLALATALLVDHANAFSRRGTSLLVADLAGELLSQARKRRNDDLVSQLLTLQGEMQLSMLHL